MSAIPRTPDDVEDDSQFVEWFDTWRGIRAEPGAIELADTQRGALEAITPSPTVEHAVEQVITQGVAVLADVADVGFLERLLGDRSVCAARRLDKVLQCIGGTLRHYGAADVEFTSAPYERPAGNGWHRDRPEPGMVIRALVALDAFTLATAATEFLPFSHRPSLRSVGIPPNTHAPDVPVVYAALKPGDAVVFDLAIGHVCGRAGRMGRQIANRRCVVIDSATDDVPRLRV